MIRTKLCELVGIKHPIIQGGMGPWKTDELAIAVSNAGGLGILSLGGIIAEEIMNVPDPPDRPKVEGTTAEKVKKYIQKIANSTKSTRGTFGVNIMVSAELAEICRTGIRATLEAREESVDIKERLRVIITSAGDPVPIAPLIKSTEIKWFHVVPSARHAKRAEKAGVDGVIASGHEGGGHVAWKSVHTIVLVPTVVKTVNVPVVAGGGFCDGAGLVAALALGACGVQMGTRFVATAESGFVNMWKQRILKSDEKDTIYARGFAGPLRYLRNRRSLELGELTLRKVPRLYLGEPDEMLDQEIWNFEQQGFINTLGTDEETALFFGGEVAGRIDDIPTVEELLKRIVREAEEIISYLQRFIDPSVAVLE